MNRIILHGFKKVMGISKKSSSVMVELLFKYKNSQFRYYYLKLMKFYKILNSDHISNFAKITLYFDIHYILSLKIILKYVICKHYIQNGKMVYVSNI